MRTVSRAAAGAVASAVASALVVGVVAACTGEVMDGAAPEEDAGAAGVDGGASGDDAGSSIPGDGGLPGSDGGPASDADLGAPDAGESPTGTGVFVAQGHVGRTLVSCDDGHTWTHDQSMDDTVVCFSDGFDCDHHPGSAKGITFGREHFYATFGWGPPGSVQRSRDGVTWEPVLEDTTFGGIAWGNDRVLAGSRNARWSDDDGDTWNDAGDTELSVWNVRSTGWVPHGGGLFVLVGEDSGEQDIVLSDDGGESWIHPTTLPAGCGSGTQNTGGVASGNGVIVVIGRDGFACRSDDGGDTWTGTSVADGVSSHLVWNGAEFEIWSRGTLHRSPDGETWTATATVPDDLHIGAVARSDEGTYVAVNAGWQQWYDRQQLYRSEDGVTWEALPADAFQGGHPIRDIGFGRVAAAGCD